MYGFRVRGAKSQGKYFLAVRYQAVKGLYRPPLGHGKDGKHYLF
jgi:hypothetical protein